jgi:GT2 family glycosyltransferase
LFDENFVYAGFEDADYCFRALGMGYKVEAYPLPFVHKELHSRFTMPGYMAQRERNIEYLCEKWDIHR